MPEYELNLRDYWWIIRKHYLILSAIFSFIWVFSIIYTHIQKPVYRAASSVRWMERKTLGNLLSELVTAKGGDPLATQARIITSLPVLERVVVELKLANEYDGQTEIMAVAYALQSGISIDIVTGTNILRIVVIHENAQMAANIANKVAEVYLKENLKEKTKESRTAREFIAEQLKEVTVKLESSEEKLAKFKDTDMPSGSALVLQEQLAGLETKRQELLQQFTLIYPDVKNIDEQINQVKEKFKNLPYKELEYSRLTREVEINAKLYKELKDKFEAARIAEAEEVEDVSIVDKAVVPRTPISPNRPLNYLLGALIGLIVGLAGIFIAEQLDTSIGTIEDVENYLGLPILGVIPFCPSTEKKDLSIFTSKQQGKSIHEKNRLLIYPQISSSIIEAYNILDTNIWSSFHGEKSPKVNIISSTVSGEGKTLVAANLAITMAKRGLRVILIDADLRRPALYRLFGLKKEPGLSDILSNTHKTKEVIRGFTDLFLCEEMPQVISKIHGLNNLQFITSGHAPSNSILLFASERMAALFNELKNDFDMIIVDTPPILPVSDVSILAPKADSVILLYQVGKTSRAALVRAKKQLEGVNARIKGIVLNCLNPQVEMNKAYYYCNQYQYYGKNQENSDV